MEFKDLLGQEDIKQHLAQTIENNRVPHAQLFLGATGYGMLPAAINYAKQILCSSSKVDQTSASNKCDKLIHPDLHFIFPVNTTSEVKKDPISKQFMAQFREAYFDNPYMNLNDWLKIIGIEKKQGLINVSQAHDIIKDVYLKPYESDYKVTIVWMAEKMNAAASNKLLKAIEEPPPKTIFLLVAENQEQILQTILSRTQIIQFKRLHNQTLREGLSKEYQLSEEQLTTIINLSNGDYHEALRMIKNDEDVLFNRNLFVSWMRLAFKKDLIGINKWVEETAALGREKQKAFLQFGLHIFREALIYNYQVSEVLQLEGAEAKFVKNFSPYVHAGNLRAYMDLFSEASYHIERNANGRILFLDITISVMKLMKMKSPHLSLKS